MKKIKAIWLSMLDEDNRLTGYPFFGKYGSVARIWRYGVTRPVLCRFRTPLENWYLCFERTRLERSFRKVPETRWNKFKKAWLSDKVDRAAPDQYSGGAQSVELRALSEFAERHRNSQGRPAKRSS